jgi:GTP-binding protein
MAIQWFPGHMHLTRKAIGERIKDIDVVIELLDARLPGSSANPMLAELIDGKPVLKVLSKQDMADPQRTDAWLGHYNVLPGTRALAMDTSMTAPAKALKEACLHLAPLRGGMVKPMRVLMCGIPNVGKSTLINTWLGEERLVAFDQPGTTRDAISVPFERGGQRYEVIDTAGLRRKGRVFEAIEKFSVVKTLQAIESANVVLLLLDATQGVTDQDAHIAGFVLESGRAVVLAVNKWDAVDAYQRELVHRSIEARLAFLKFAAIHLISAKKRQGLSPVWASIAQAHRAATCKMSTPVLTRLLLEAVQFQSPQRAGMFRPKMRYAHQGGMNPPVIIIHGNSLEHVGASYKRYLEGRFRKAFNLEGTPLRIEMKTSENPYRNKAD